MPHEVPPSWPVEALKAQACAARAFALGLAQAEPGLDVYCDVRSQAYVGVGIEDRSTDAAVTATAGVVPVYKGKPIVAFYFSCSGGHTENIENGWPGAAPVPYLKGVDDPYDYYGSLHDWGPLRRTAAQIGGPLGVEGIPARRLHGQARHVAAHRQGRAHRQRRRDLHGRQHAAHEARPQQHVGDLHQHVDQPSPRDDRASSAGGSLTLRAASTRRWPPAQRAAHVLLRRHVAQPQRHHDPRQREPRQRLQGHVLRRTATT